MCYVNISGITHASISRSSVGPLESSPFSATGVSTMVYIIYQTNGSGLNSANLAVDSGLAPTNTATYMKDCVRLLAALHHLHD